jgi:poly(A) polymerase
MAPLINNVPAARVFDEMLKLLMSGHALACLQQLRKEGLHHGCCRCWTWCWNSRWAQVRHAGAGIDRRPHPRRQDRLAGLPVCLAAVAPGAGEVGSLPRSGRADHPGAASGGRRRARLADREAGLQRKIGSDMRDIWAMQPRFERRVGKAPYKLLEHLRFRAGYDFLLLRCASGEIDAEIGEWWTAFYEGDEASREELISSASQPSGGGKRRRWRQAQARPAPRRPPQRRRWRRRRLRPRGAST